MAISPILLYNRYLVIGGVIFTICMSNKTAIVKVSTKKNYYYAREIIQYNVGSFALPNTIIVGNQLEYQTWPTFHSKRGDQTNKKRNKAKLSVFTALQ